MTARPKDSTASYMDVAEAAADALSAAPPPPPIGRQTYNSRVLRYASLTTFNVIAHKTYNTHIYMYTGMSMACTKDNDLDRFSTLDIRSKVHHAIKTYKKKTRNFSIIFFYIFDTSYVYIYIYI